MAHLLPYAECPAAPLTPTRNISASPKSALLVESDESLTSFLRRSLEDERYAVRTAANSEEGLRLYRDCGPFNVVLIDYCVRPSDGVRIDYLAPWQTHGIGLASAIRQIHPSQGIIVAALAYQNAGEVLRPRELMHIPVLIDVCNFRLRGLLEKIEVDRAIEALTSPELLRLRHFAAFHVRGLGRAARGRTGEDLLQEALMRTLIGAEDVQKGRHWNRDVPFAWHLIGAMQSISNQWKRQFKDMEPYLISEFPVRDVEGQENSPIDNVASVDAAADQRLIEKDEEDRVLTIFKDDLEATQVLHDFMDGLKKSEIKSKYGLDETKYVAAVKRIRMKLLGGRNVGGARKKHDQ